MNAVTSVDRSTTSNAPTPATPNSSKTSHQEEAWTYGPTGTSPQREASERWWLSTETDSSDSEWSSSSGSSDRLMQNSWFSGEKQRRAPRPRSTTRTLRRPHLHGHRLCRQALNEVAIVDMNKPLDQGDLLPSSHHKGRHCIGARSAHVHDQLRPERRMHRIWQGRHRSHLSSVPSTR